MKSENAKTILLGILAVGISLGLLASVLVVAGMPSSRGLLTTAGRCFPAPRPPEISLCPTGRC